MWSGQVMALDLRAQLNRTSVCFRSHTASWIKSVVQSCKIHGLHSDCMDNEDEEDLADEVDGKNGTDELSTIIGARTVTLTTVRYAIIPPAVCTSKMHYSGIIQLADIPITPEVEKNQAGRIAHVRSGLATHLYDVDDSGLVLQSAS